MLNRTALLLLLSGLLLAAPAARAEPSRPVAAEVVVAPTASHADAVTYAHREAASRPVADFKGGDEVDGHFFVVGVSATTLLLVILVLLLV